MVDHDPKWFQQPMRWGQINIREVEPPHFDVTWWEAWWRKIRLDGITLNCGGTYAYYPTELRDHHRSRWLGNRDLFGELVAAVKRCDMRVLARIDPSLSYEDVYYRHPDWFALDRYGRVRLEQIEAPRSVSGGQPTVSEQLFIACMNGPYYWEFIPDVIREIHSRYDVDGIFGSEWDGRGVVCYCRRCRTLFKEATNYELPDKPDASDMAWKQWYMWHQQRLRDIWQHWDAVTKEAKPGSIWMGNHSERGFLSDHADMINVDQQRRKEHDPIWIVGETGKKMHALTRGRKPYYHIFSSNVHARHLAKTEAEFRLYIASAVLADSRPWFTIIGGVQEDRRQFGPIEDMYQWHAEHEDRLRDRNSLAEVAVAFYEKDRFIPVEKRGGDSFRGMYYAMLRNRIPFDLVHASRLDEDALGHYKLLVLPNVGALSEDEAADIRRFVEGGGAILATYETGAYDEWGEPRQVGVIDDLLGVDGRWQSLGSLDHAYAKLHGPHPLLEGLGDTTTTLSPEHLAIVDPAADRPPSPLTLIPPYPHYPPESTFSRAGGDVGRPLVILSEGGETRGRSVYWAANLDAFFWQKNTPDHGQLLANSVRWALTEPLSVQVTGPGVIEVHPYRQETNIQIHMVNYTTPDLWKVPVHELIPVGTQRVRVRLPEGATATAEARCLVSGHTLPVIVTDGWAEAELPGILDHEIVAIDLDS
jgi:hypothetical protein